MQLERVVVGYVELTAEESQRLLKEVSKDQEVKNLTDLQTVMDNYDSRIIEPVLENPLLEDAEREERPEETTLTEEQIEFFPKIENGKRYRIKASKKQPSKK